MEKLIDKLPKIRGKYRENAAVKNWFDVGGKAAVLFKPADKNDLADFLKNCDKNIKICVIGAASNVIVSDAGFDGVVIRFGAEFAKISHESDVLQAGCGALCANVAQYSKNAALSGLEFFSGIPGSVGGAVAMNAGCYGDDVASFLLDVEVLDYDGNFHVIKVEEIDFSYRKNPLSDEFIFISARFKLEESTSEVVLNKITELCANREKSQPIRAKTGGSTFKNPFWPDLSAKRAWQLIDEAGCRGLKVGGAQISEKHCNFMINSDSATASDLINLGNEVKKRVKDSSGVVLEWEVKIIGE